MKTLTGPQVPSPADIAAGLYRSPPPPVPTLPTSWWGNFLLTPAGGLTSSPLQPSDQLVVAQVTYDAGSGWQQLRTRLFLLESKLYYDFVFLTDGTTTDWYWNISDPSTGIISQTLGPYPCASTVPAPDFLVTNNFAYAGSWNVVGNYCDSFAGQAPAASAGTWFSFMTLGALARIMNVDAGNDYGIPVLGAYYFANCSLWQQDDSKSLEDFRDKCKGRPRAQGAMTPMVTLLDLQTQMMNPPDGAPQIPCTQQDINKIIAGISYPETQPTPPSWSDQVTSNCYMIGQDVYPYFCQLYYDWDFGEQITVFVTKDPSGNYTVRQDEVLPKGVVGPAINFNWADTWATQCVQAGGGVVPMSVPNFVQAGGGVCRATFQNDPYFPDMTIWSIRLDSGTGTWANFWDWFDTSWNGIVFSLDPASSLTLIDYQTFVRNATIDPSVWSEPTTPPCSSALTSTRHGKLGFTPR